MTDCNIYKGYDLDAQIAKIYDSNLWIYQKITLILRFLCIGPDDGFNVVFSVLNWNKITGKNIIIAFLSRHTLSLFSNRILPCGAVDRKKSCSKSNVEEGIELGLFNFLDLRVRLSNLAFHMFSVNESVIFSYWLII